MSVKFLVATSVSGNVYYGRDKALASAIYEREVKREDVKHAVLFRQDGLDRSIVKAAGPDVKIDTLILCPYCRKKTWVSRLACEKVGWPTCHGTMVVTN